jgi:thymidine kinase
VIFFITGGFMFTLIVGPMFSGKSTELLRQLERYTIAGKKVLLLRPDIDNREFLCHNGRKVDIEQKIIKDSDFLSIEHRFDVYAIDEGQFFDKEKLYVFVKNKINKIVLVSGLIATSELNPFDSILDLFPLADNIIKLSAVCQRCGKDASYTFFKGKKSQDVLVGSSQYEARCWDCWNVGNFESFTKS